MLDGIFLRQVWFGNDAMLLDLARDESPEGRARLHYFLINKGPWSRLDHDEPFVPGAPPKPEGANFYPAGATKAEIEKWIQSLPEAERARATGFFTVVRRAPNGQLHARPVQRRVSERAGARGRAAARGGRPRGRADAEGVSHEARATRSCRTTTTTATSRGWSSKGAIEPTIGPYEVYEDEFFNYKAAFEAFITVRDDAESGKLPEVRRRAAGHREPPADRSEVPQSRSSAALAPHRASSTSSSRAGDANRGVQTAAFNLPNDERVLREKGAKRVMLKNVQDAKFAKIARADLQGRARAGRSEATSSFDAFFTHILMHELMHGLGPHNITVGGRATTVRQEMKEASSCARGGQGRHLRPVRAAVPRSTRACSPKSLEQSMYTTFLASAFRSIRFGINEAHGTGIAIQLNYLLDQGGFVVRRRRHVRRRSRRRSRTASRR